MSDNEAECLSARKSGNFFKRHHRLQKAFFQATSYFLIIYARLSCTFSQSRRLVLSFLFTTSRDFVGNSLLRPGDRVQRYRNREE